MVRRDALITTPLSTSSRSGSNAAIVGFRAANAMTKAKLIKPEFGRSMNSHQGPFFAVPAANSYR